ncbi:MAG: DNA alkylation repair protein [Gemmatimonadota bacterium]
MAEPLKNFFSPKIATRIADMIAAVSPVFQAKAFVADAVRGLDALELVPRGWHIAHALHRHLPPDFESAAAILKASLGPRLAATEGNGLAPFLYLPHVLFTAEYGIDDLETALDLQYELTRRFSAEYSIRVFIERYPERTLERLRVWAGDPDVHARRLVSEGTRPRLPWAPRLREFQKDPRPVLELLELLKDDPELYVRRSVANNLNDIGKDHPDILFDTCQRWGIGASADRQWLIRHALRSAVKRGESGALQVLGYHRAPSARIEHARITPRRAKIGGTVEFSFDLVSTARRKQPLLVDFRVLFVKADRTTSPKVFKLKTVELAPGESISLSGRLSLRQMTTRKHYPGRHQIDAVVNGATLPLGHFDLDR